MPREHRPAETAIKMCGSTDCLIFLSSKFTTLILSFGQFLSEIISNQVVEEVEKKGLENLFFYFLAMVTELE